MSFKRGLANFYVGRHHHLTEEHARMHGHSEREIQEHLASGRQKGYSSVKDPISFHRTTDREEYARRSRIGFGFRRPHPVGCNCPFHKGHRRKQSSAMKGIGRRR